MEIHIVQSEDNIYTIADNYGISVTRLIQDNGIVNPYSLVPGQVVVITYPSQTHTVEEGDSLTSIAETYGVTMMQLLRNNAFLSDREYINPGETIVIRYDTNQKVTTIGYAYSFINKATLIRTLPYLTYLSVFNYRITDKGDVITYGDDTEVVKLAIEYSVIPIMMISSLSIIGEANIELVYEILLNEEYRISLFTNIINILKSSNFYGVNIMLTIINESNQQLYIDLLTEISNILKQEGYQLYITIDPKLKVTDDIITFEQIDYSAISTVVDGITFLQYVWGSKPGPPEPITSLNLLSNFIDYVVARAPQEKISLGNPLIAYDWILPYYTTNANAASLTLNAAMIIAYDVGTTIQFDEISQTPYFLYSTTYAAEVIEHIVWLVDARTVNAVNELITEYSLSGSGLWNIMVYYQQIWTLIISQYEIVKILPEI